MSENKAKIIVVGPHVYGYGDTLKEAKANAKKELGKVSGKKAVFKGYVTDPSGYVDHFGYILADEFLYELGEV